MDHPRPPIDLHDDFGTDDAADRRTISWMAVAFAVVLVLASCAVLWVLA